MSEQHTITCDWCDRVEPMIRDKTFSMIDDWNRPGAWKREEGKDFCSNECRKGFLIDASRPHHPRQFGWFQRLARKLAL